jgi:hypothetical protein
LFVDGAGFGFYTALDGGFLLAGGAGVGVALHRDIDAATGLHIKGPDLVGQGEKLAGGFVAGIFRPRVATTLPSRA